MEPALIETLRGVGSSLVLCAVTTAAGFYSFIPTTFQGVSELGLIAGTGVFFGLLVSVTLLPALVAQFAPSLDGPQRADADRSEDLRAVQPAAPPRARRHGGRDRRGVRVAALAHLRQQSDPPARPKQRIRHHAARARRERRGADAESRGRRARSRYRARLGRAAARAARGAQRDHGRVARAERPAGQGRGARGPRSAHGSDVRRAHARAARPAAARWLARNSGDGVRGSSGGARVACRGRERANVARGRAAGRRANAACASSTARSPRGCRASSAGSPPACARSRSAATRCRNPSPHGSSARKDASSSRSCRPRT